MSILFVVQSGEAEAPSVLLLLTSPSPALILFVLRTLP